MHRGGVQLSGAEYTSVRSLHDGTGPDRPRPPSLASRARLEVRALAGRMPAQELLAAAGPRPSMALAETMSARIAVASAI